MKKTFEWKTRSSEQTPLVVTLDMELTNDGKFSCSGAVYEKRKAPKNCIFAGQCLDEMCTTELGKDPSFQRIAYLWRKYHLNALNPGTPEQEAALPRELRPADKYTQACEWLKEHNLYEVMHEGKPYAYGTGWLFRPIPADDLAEIKKLMGD